MRTIVVVGGGYAGFYAAWKLEKKLRRDEARVDQAEPVVSHLVGERGGWKRNFAVTRRGSWWSIPGRT